MVWHVPHLGVCPPPMPGCAPPPLVRLCLDFPRSPSSRSAGRSTSQLSTSGSSRKLSSGKVWSQKGRIDGTPAQLANLVALRPASSVLELRRLESKVLDPTTHAKTRPASASSKTIAGPMASRVSASPRTASAKRGLHWSTSNSGNVGDPRSSGTPLPLTTAPSTPAAGSHGIASMREDWMLQETFAHSSQHVLIIY